MSRQSENFVEAPRWRIDYAGAKARKVEGINGQALDLSMAKPIRESLSFANPLKGYLNNFTVSVWVKGDSISGLSSYSFDVITATHDHDEADRTGWKIGVQTNGAWYWQLTEKETYMYEPTVFRQPIRDEKWHFLSFTYCAGQQEIRLYYDGVNVGIYSVSLNSDQYWKQAEQLCVGGDARTDHGTMSFPGLIDEVWIDDRSLTVEEIRKRYSLHRSVKPVPEKRTPDLKVMTFNIWDGGREMGAEIGVQRIIDVIKESGADVILMQETYGSGPIIADALGYYFYLRSHNISIMSRYPIMETYPYFEAFHCGGVRIRLNQDLYVNAFSIWLHYLSDYAHDLQQQADLTDEQLLEGEQRRITELRKIMKSLEPLAEKSDQEPLLLAGDFNSGSHLDWIEATKDRHNGYVFPFPQSLELTEKGYNDTYREIHPNPVADPGVTWSMVEMEEYIFDRIDFIYRHGSRLRPQSAKTIEIHPVRYPSDHAAVLVDFRIHQETMP
ncbi:LamG-like jellyroll fold domain-containing protein [Bacillus sp. SD088]|uniref:LamG-like jellyroll fold domain-containing protein n=1 Tax=Bacillus sp. SD088 TaxID=2782012 RepID=UPI001A961691|nr:LamG-like jellyroll fold domain-containing protein [Bacillus sp. SD088]MBO0993192.1 endonuclease/exonuclease/phosphatase family protein [Bacillus sp. SD088]